MAQGSLTENKANEILQRIPGVRDYIQDAQSETDFENLIQIYAKEYDISAEELQKSQKNLLEEKERISKIIRERVSGQTEALSALLKVVPEKSLGMERASILEDLRDHWWVQVEANGDWLDLDPTIMDAIPGDIVTSVKNTWDAEDLDEDLFHLLTIRIIVERWEGGSLREETVLEHDLQPSLLIGERIELRHNPLDWPKDDELYDNDQPIAKNCLYLFLHVVRIQVLVPKP